LSFLSFYLITQRAAPKPTLPQGWTLKRFLGKHPSNPPNPLLANAFFRAGYIESWGRGIEKISRECREHDITPPIYDFEMSGLMLTFQTNPAHLLATADGEKTPVETLGKTPAQILELLRNNPHLTVPEIAKRISKSERAVNRTIQASNRWIPKTRRLPQGRPLGGARMKRKPIFVRSVQKELSEERATHRNYSSNGSGTGNCVSPISINLFTFYWPMFAIRSAY